MKKSNLIYNFLFVLPLIIIAKIYFSWFFIPQITGGDWPYYSANMLKDFSIFAPIWTSQGGIGFGGSNVNFPLFSYLYFTAGFFGNFLHMSWDITYKATWFGLPLLLGGFGIVYLYKNIRKNASFAELSLAIFVYLCNTYFLMITSGGQMGIVLAYSVAPLVIGKIIKNKSMLAVNSSFLMLVRNGLILGLLLSLEILFDIRITFLTCLILFLYFIYNFIFFKNLKLKSLFVYLITTLIAVIGLHLYWILPFYFFKLFSVPTGVLSSSGFSFFSFADFSHSFSLLHPNWPENIFGKVYFLQPEFLIYPLLAFFGLLFISKMSKDEKYSYLFFGLLAIIGVFLAKGVNPPFGELNMWLFTHVPGFNLFRDPTKYYLFISLSYSIMIPLSLHYLYINFKKHVVFNLLLFILIGVVLMFSVRQAWMGQLKGTFVYNPVQKEYLELDNFLFSQNSFFRTLWLPDQSRFRFASENHPMLIANDVFGTSSQSAILKKLSDPNYESKLQKLGIKYIIIPYDSTHEIYLTDRKYDENKRKDFVKNLDSTSWLKKILFGKIVVYEVQNYIDHFSFSTGGKVTYKKNLSTDYSLYIDSDSSQKIIFSETYHSGWVGFVNGRKINSIRTQDFQNSFVVPAGKYTLNVQFIPQMYQKYFYAISIVSLVVVCGFLFITRKD